MIPNLYENPSSADLRQEVWQLRKLLKGILSCNGVDADSRQIAAPTVPLDSGKWPCIEADFPWPHADHYNMRGFQDVREYRNHSPYDTLTARALLEFSAGEINRLAPPEIGALWMWTTKDFEGLALACMALAGFHKKQTFVWVKTSDPDAQEPPPTMGMGHWGRNSHELLFYGVRPKFRGKYLTPMAGRTTLRNVIYARPEGHSRKPDLFYDLIRANSPGPCLSLFQRTPRAGWTCWGNEIPGEVVWDTLNES